MIRNNSYCSYRFNVDLFKVLLAMNLYLLKLLLLWAQFAALN